MELSKSVGAVFLTWPSAEFFLAEKIYDECIPDVKSTRDENCGFDRPSARGRVKTDVGIAVGGNGIMIENEQFFVGVVRQLLLKKENGAWR